MSQRILVGISAVMAVCCIAVVGIAWSMMQESRAFNLQMLEQFKLAQERSAGETSENLHPILFQLVQDGTEDKAAVGFQGMLFKRYGENIIFTVDAVSDTTGLLDFGKLPWGEYVLKLKAPWGEAPVPLGFSTIPGRKYEQTIVCPAHAPQDVEVEFQVNWQNRPEEEYYLLCDFRTADFDKSKGIRNFMLLSYQQIQDESWIYQHDMNKESERCVFLIDLKNDRATRCLLTVDGKFEKLDHHELAWQSTVNILQGVYHMPTVYLLQKDDLKQLNALNPMITTKVAAFDNLGINLSNYLLPENGLIISPFKKLDIEPELVVDKPPSELKQIHGFKTGMPTLGAYAATEKQPNVWEINIPDLFPITLESGSLSSVR